MSERLNSSRPKRGSLRRALWILGLFGLLGIITPLVKLSQDKDRFSRIHTVFKTKDTWMTTEFISDHLLDCAALAVAVDYPKAVIRACCSLECAGKCNACLVQIHSMKVDFHPLYLT
jgi:hypothetical protein